MKVLLTGATGFLGRHIVPRLVARGHSVIALVREPAKAASLPWMASVDSIPFAMGEQAPGEALAQADAMMHLAWQGLPAYRDDIHLTFNLPASLRLVREALAAGVGRVQVAGTCLEYGLQEGCLAEDLETRPVLAYPEAKDQLRRTLLEEATPGSLQWVRLFYMYGEGQNPKSLLAALDTAIADGDESFAMSGGEQLRDYAPVETITEDMVALLEAPDAAGVFNCCSGQPISVRQLVGEAVARRGSAIRMNLGVYDYPDYEPMAFWGDNRRIRTALGRA